MTSKEISELLSLKVGGRFLHTRDEMERFSHDETEDLVFWPEAVFLPKDADDVGKVLRHCEARRIPVVPRGAGTGLSGGSLAVSGGLMISLEKLTTVNIDVKNGQATVGAGVITENFIRSAGEVGLYYPVDPSSKGSCFMGGNAAHGAGGPRVVKYGTIREYILNLQVVLMSGEIIWTGANTIKNATGYNLTQLMIGSEGTLGVITALVVKLIPLPKFDLLLFAQFSSAEAACRAVASIFTAGFTPSAVEFMERDGMQYVIHHEKISFKLPSGAEAWLLIEFDGDDVPHLLAQGEAAGELLVSGECEDVMIAESTSQKESWWAIRRKMAESVRSHSVYKEEDTVVPRGELPALINGIKEIGGRYGFRSICYGHAGDGNLHINILKDQLSDEFWTKQLSQAIVEIFQLTVSLGGTISGEHGIGLVQKSYMPLHYRSTHLRLMKGIKALFDPYGLMNPGKLF